MINKNNKGRPACQSLSGEYSRQYGYNHCSEKTASFSVRLMAGRHFDICILHLAQLTGIIPSFIANVL